MVVPYQLKLDRIDMAHNKNPPPGGDGRPRLTLKLILALLPLPLLLGFHVGPGALHGGPHP